MRTNKEALLFRVGGLGDLLVALPAISLARRSLPGFRLTLACRDEYGALLKVSGIVDALFSFEDTRMSPIFSGARDADPGPAWLIDFSLALGWLNRSGEWPLDDWWEKQGIGHTFFAYFDSGANLSMSRFFFERTRDFLRSSGMNMNNATDILPLDPAGPDPDMLFDECARLPLPGDLRKKALADFCLRKLRKNERRFIVHPGSGGLKKRWPFANFLEVIRRAASSGIGGVLVTGEAEAEHELLLKKERLPAGWSWASRPPILSLAGLLAESTHYLGNDSGPTHLAAACGVSVLALFREDNEPAWRPFGRTRILAAQSVSEIALADVLTALDRLE